MGRRARTRRAATALGLLVAVMLAMVAGCTTEDAPGPPPPGTQDPTSSASPSPTGLRVAVVLPPRPGLGVGQTSALERELRALGEELAPGITELRLVRADTDAFVEDLAVLLAGRDYDLVCLLHRDAGRAALEARRLVPDSALCALPDVLPPDEDAEVVDGLVGVELRTAELGHLVGVAAATTVGSGTVGVVLDPLRLGASGFREGLRAGIGDREVVEVAVREGMDVTAAVEEVMSSGIDVLVLDAGQGAEQALAVAAAEVPVLAPGVLLVSGELAGAASLSWRIRWGEVLRLVLEDLLEGTVTPHRSLGLVDEAFELAPGPRSGLAVRNRLEQVDDELRRGVRDPRVPDPDQTPAPGA